jgi:hypothetical protein
LLGSDYDSSPYTQAGERVARLAVSGIRLVVGEFRADVTKTRKDGSRGRLRISYGDAKDATDSVKWLWRFVDAAKTPGELYGRALVVIAAEQYATRMMLPASQRTRRSGGVPGSVATEPGINCWSRSRTRTRHASLGSGPGWPWATAFGVANAAESACGLGASLRRSGCRRGATAARIRTAARSRCTSSNRFSTRYLVILGGASRISLLPAACWWVERLEGPVLPGPLRAAREVVCVADIAAASASMQTVNDLPFRELALVPDRVEVVLPPW